MEEMAPVVFPVVTARAVSALYVLLPRLDLLPGSLLPRLDLLPGNVLPRLDLLPGSLLPGSLLPGSLLSRLDLLPRLDLLQGLLLLPSLLPALPPALYSLPGLAIRLVMVIKTTVLLQEPTIRTIEAVFFGLFPASLALP